MKKGTAKTATAYLASLPPERRKELAAVRKVVKENLPKGYQEAMAAGLITWEVPLTVYPDTYNGHALWYVALTDHKGYASLYLMAAYGSKPLSDRLKAGFKDAGKKLDMGKSCIHFKKADDLALDVIGEIVAAVPLTEFVASAEAARRR